MYRTFAAKTDAKAAVSHSKAKAAEAELTTLIEKCFSTGFAISLLANSRLGSLDDTSFDIAS